MADNRKKYTLGIYQGHNSTICLIQDSEVIFALSEERISRKKNDGQFPYQSISTALNYLRITKDDIDHVIFNSIPLESTMSDSSNSIFRWILQLRTFIENTFHNGLYLRLNDMAIKFYWTFINKKNQKEVLRHFSTNGTKVSFPEHHMLHTYAGLYCSSFPQENRDCLIFSCDGEGDGISATVNIYKDKKIERISIIHYSTSLGHFYEAITHYLGMKKMEHEYKVMGLAPYSKDSTEAISLKEKLSKIFYFSGLDFKTKIHSTQYSRFIHEICKGYRFDNVATAAQDLIEEILYKWVENYITKFKIINIVLTGGVFMNVKVNSVLLKNSSAENIFIMPSCADESIAVGAAIYGSIQDKCHVKPPTNYYLGTDFDTTFIEKFIDTINKDKFFIENAEQIEKRVAQLLSDGHILAHFFGRMELGARALGNRSIFADASRPSLVYELNKMIKRRDFWMPFAPIILDEDMGRYIVKADNRQVNSDTMMCAFETTPLARQHLYNAMHPYDKTVRAQIVTSSSNTRLYSILKEYKKLTGMGGFLNTSFNIHGYPIVNSPSDALDVLEKSGLEYLILHDWIIRKKNMSNIDRLDL